MKWQDVGGQPNYETIELGDVTSYTDTTVVNGTDTGIWAYEMVAKDSSGSNIAISNSAVFNSATGEITYDDSGFDSGTTKSFEEAEQSLTKPTSADTIPIIEAYLDSIGIDHKGITKKAELLALLE